MMEESELKSLTLVLAGRNFPVQVTAEEESAVLQMVEELNQVISDTQATYPSRDKLDCVLMTLLTISTDRQLGKVKANTDQNKSDDAEIILDLINEELSDITV